MRVTIKADGASTEQLRALCSALGSCFAGAAQVKCEGPERWTVETPPLSTSQFAVVVGNLVRDDGETLASRRADRIASVRASS